MNPNTHETSVNLANTPWRNVYWFARMLINTDQYGAIGKNKKAKTRQLVNRIDTFMQQHSMTDDEMLAVCKHMISTDIQQMFKPASKGYGQTADLIRDLNAEIQTKHDLVAFTVAVKYILMPINAAMAVVPSNDRAFCFETAKCILDTLGETGFGKVLRTWDTLGVRGCLDAERCLVVDEFTKLRANLSALDLERSDFEDNVILTAFVQEFERRLGQKRKGRAGTSLEDAATFLFDYYRFSSHPKPDHYQTDVEVDKWFKCKDGWSIGISCKRTLRERWKQVSSADSNALSRYKIKEIWHLTTFDQDLSDEKLTMLGQQRQVFYLADDSERYQSAAAHPGMRDYVRPLSALIRDIRREQYGEP